MNKPIIVRQRGFTVGIVASSAAMAADERSPWP